MKPRLLGAFGSLVFVASGMSAAIADASSGPCGPRDAHTLAADSVARIYELKGTIYGCSIHGSKSYRLGGSSYGQQKVGPVALSGEDAAYGLSRSGVDTISASVRVRRLSDGKMLHDDAATTKPLPAEYFQTLYALVVKSDGAVAWIAEAGSIFEGKTSDVEVHKDDTTGRALLDSGSSIRRRSLRLHGSTLTWRHGETTRSALLS